MAYIFYVVKLFCAGIVRTMPLFYMDYSILVLEICKV